MDKILNKNGFPMDEIKDEKMLLIQEDKHHIELNSGYALEAEKGTFISLKAPDGRICLKITLTPQGPAVELQSVSLSIATQGEFKVACRQMEFNADKDVAIRCGGNIELNAGGEMGSEALAHRFRAVLGDFEVKANDDVRLDGERILLNSPKPRSPYKDNIPLEQEKK